MDLNGDQVDPVHSAEASMQAIHEFLHPRKARMARELVRNGLLSFSAKEVERNCRAPQCKSKRETMWRRFTADGINIEEWPIIHPIDTGHLSEKDSKDVEIEGKD